jgi:hypothetical protein
MAIKAKARARDVNEELFKRRKCFRVILLSYHVTLISPSNDKWWKRESLHQYLILLLWYLREYQSCSFLVESLKLRQTSINEMSIWCVKTYCCVTWLLMKLQIFGKVTRQNILTSPKAIVCIHIWPACCNGPGLKAELLLLERLYLSTSS